MNCEPFVEPAGHTIARHSVVQRNMSEFMPKDFGEVMAFTWEPRRSCEQYQTELRVGHPGRVTGETSPFGGKSFHLTRSASHLHMDSPEHGAPHHLFKFGAHGVSFILEHAYLRCERGVVCHLEPTAIVSTELLGRVGQLERRRRRSISPVSVLNRGDWAGSGYP